MPTSLLEQFVTLWVVIGPIGTVPVFIALTGSLSPAQRAVVVLTDDHRYTAGQREITALAMVAVLAPGGSG